MKQVYKLYKNKVNLEFDDSAHTYKIDGKVVYGVTSIVSVLAKPALMFWAVNQAIDFLAANLEAGKPYDEIQIKELLAEAKKQHTLTKNKAADIGSLIHDWVSDFLKKISKGEKPPKMLINKEAQNAIKGLKDWFKVHKVKMVYSERRIYHPELNYAGTLDLLAKVDGKLSVVDFKTGNAIYSDYYLQVAAYKVAIERELGKKVEASYIVRLSQENKDKGIPAFEVQEVPDIEKQLGVFLSCKSIYEWQLNNRKSEIIKKFNGQ